MSSVLLDPGAAGGQPPCLLTPNPKCTQCEWREVLTEAKRAVFTSVVIATVRFLAPQL